MRTTQMSAQAVGTRCLILRLKLTSALVEMLAEAMCRHPTLGSTQTVLSITTTGHSIKLRSNGYKEVKILHG